MDNKNNKKRTEEMIFEQVIPDECWEVIRDTMGDNHNRYLNKASLVSKQFYSLTRFLRRKIHIRSYDWRYKQSDQRRRSRNHQFLLRTTKLLSVNKYPNLRQVSINCCCLMNELGKDMDTFVSDILCLSGLDLHEIYMYYVRSNPPTLDSWRLLGSKMKHLTVVKYRWSIIDDETLIAIGDALPFLEHLDIGGGCLSTISDYGIETVSRKLLKLRKIVMDWVRGTSDKSLIALSNNCKFLNEVNFRHCGVTEHGIGYMLRHSLNLRTLELEPYNKHSEENTYTLKNSFAYARSLMVLYIICRSSHSNVDEVVGSIADAKLPLEKVSIMNPESSFSSPTSLSRLVGSCKSSLRRLELNYLGFLTDEMINQLCHNKNLPNLEYVRIRDCSKVTEIAFFILTKECPSLETLRLHLSTLERLGGVPWCYSFSSFSSSHKSFKIRTLALNLPLITKYEMLKEIANICPYLESLNLKKSGKDEILANGGLECIMEGCPLIQCLVIRDDKGVSDLLAQINTSRLEVRMPHFSYSFFPKS